MATYQKTSKGHVCVTIRIKGYKPVSKTHRTKSLAQQWAMPIEDAMRSGTYNKSKDDLLSTVFDRYVEQIIPLKKTTKFHLTNINNLRKSFNDVSMRELTASLIVEYVTGRLKDVKSSTVRKEINTLSNVWNTATALWGYEIPNNPIAQAKHVLKNTRALRQPPPRSRRLADGEEKLLINALSDAVEPKLVAMLTLETARRMNEILSIDQSKIQFRSGRAFLLVEDNKTGDNLSVPLSDRAADLLSDWQGFTVRSDTVSQAMSRACKRCGIVGLTINDLRHEALSRLFEHGLDVAEVMAISGHKSAETLLKIYTQVKGENVSDKLFRLRL